MTFCKQALQHNAGEVRERTEKIIIALYKEKGEPVKNYLPPDDDKTRKNVLYKKIFEAFDRIDGKPTKDDLKVRFTYVIFVVFLMKGLTYYLCVIVCSKICWYLIIHFNDILNLEVDLVFRKKLSSIFSKCQIRTIHE